MKKLIAIVTAAAFLSGCATTKGKQGQDAATAADYASGALDFLKEHAPEPVENGCGGATALESKKTFETPKVANDWIALALLAVTGKRPGKEKGQIEIKVRWDVDCKEKGNEVQ